MQSNQTISSCYIRFTIGLLYIQVFKNLLHVAQFQAISCLQLTTSKLRAITLLYSLQFVLLLTILSQRYIGKKIKAKIQNCNNQHSGLQSSPTKIEKYLNYISISFFFNNFDACIYDHGKPCKESIRQQNLISSQTYLKLRNIINANLPIVKNGQLLLLLLLLLL